MKKFEVGKRYAIEKLGYKSSTEAIEVSKRGKSFITFHRVFNGVRFAAETERAKIRGNLNEYLIIFGGIVSDSVRATDCISAEQ